MGTLLIGRAKTCGAGALIGPRIGFAKAADTVTPSDPANNATASTFFIRLDDLRTSNFLFDTVDLASHLFYQQTMIETS